MRMLHSISTMPYPLCHSALFLCITHTHTHKRWQPIIWITIWCLYRYAAIRFHSHSPLILFSASKCPFCREEQLHVPRLSPNCVLCSCECDWVSKHAVAQIQSCSESECEREKTTTATTNPLVWALTICECYRVPYACMWPISFHQHLFETCLCSALDVLRSMWMRCKFHISHLMASTDRFFLFRSFFVEFA